MLNAVGLLELASIAKGVEAADAMLKASGVHLLEARPVCPGKYIILVCGEVAAVQSSVDAGGNIGKDSVLDEFILPNIHPSVIEAFSCSSPYVEIGALGIIETFSIASLIIAADAAVKAASVELLEIRTGIGGKSFATLTGDVSCVSAAVEAGAALASEKGMLVEKVVIPSPHQNLKGYLY